MYHGLANLQIKNGYTSTLSVYNVSLSHSVMMKVKQKQVSVKIFLIVFYVIENLIVFIVMTKALNIQIHFHT